MESRVSVYYSQDEIQIYSSSHSDSTLLPPFFFYDNNGTIKVFYTAYLDKNTTYIRSKTIDINKARITLENIQDNSVDINKLMTLNAIDLSQELSRHESTYTDWILVNKLSSEFVNRGFAANKNLVNYTHGTTNYIRKYGDSVYLLRFGLKLV